MKEKGMKVFSRKKWMIALVMAVVVAAMTFSFVGPTAAEDNKSADQVDKITYVVEFGGQGFGEFISVDVPEIATEVIEYQDGDDRILRKRPGRNRVSNLVLRSALANPALDDLWTWRLDVISGRFERQSGSIILAGQHGEEVDRYNILHAWPCAWRIVTLEDDGNKDTVVVEIEIAAEEVYRQH